MEFHSRGPLCYGQRSRPHTTDGLDRTLIDTRFAALPQSRQAI